LDETIIDDLKSAIADFSFIEVLNGDITRDRVRVLMRVHDDSSWLPVLKLILREERRQDNVIWSIHVCRQFMLRPDNDDVLAFAWNFILRSRNLKGAVADIRRVIGVAKSAITFENGSQNRRSTPMVKGRKPKVQTKPQPDQKSTGDIMEYPLMADPNRNLPEVSMFSKSPGRQKGAHLIGG
jgi:hypothetical protein